MEAFLLDGRPLQTRKEEFTMSSKSLWFLWLIIIQYFGNLGAGTK